MVHPVGFEPTHLAAPEPESGVYANFTTGATRTYYLKFDAESQPRFLSFSKIVNRPGKHPSPRAFTPTTPLSLVLGHRTHRGRFAPRRTHGKRHLVSVSSVCRRRWLSMCSADFSPLFFIFYILYTVKYPLRPRAPPPCPVLAASAARPPQKYGQRGTSS